MEATATVTPSIETGLTEENSDQQVVAERSEPTESPPAFLPDTKAPPGADAIENPAQAEEDDSSTHWNL